MTADRQLWSQAAALFDELAPRRPADRHAILARQEMPEPVRRWLDDLLQAHDTDDSLIIDRRVDDLARELTGAADVPDPEELLGQQFGPWQARRTVGRGGMGVVLEGERADGRFDMRVAIKVLDPSAVGDDSRSQIEEEVRTLAQLEHPGIARLVDGGVRDDGVGWLAMEFVDGQPLDAWCDQQDLSRSELVALFRQFAMAVSYCHREFVVHGDIKPGNILVDEDGRSRLLDFGIAARVADPASGSAAAPRVRWCSPGYASPERLAGRAPSIADDVFALGAILFRLLTGRSVRPAPIQTRLLSGNPPESADTAPAPAANTGDSDLDAIIARSLAATPEDRYRSVEAMLEDLDRWSQGFPVAARNGGRLYRFRCWLGRHRTLAAAGILVIVGLLSGTGVALWQADRARLAAERAEQNARAAEESQERAEAINRFLLDLFEAEIPDLPPDEMPTTRQLVEVGIERARDPESGPPALRAELMVTLAGILIARRQLDDADGLIEEARGLVDLDAHPSLAIRLAVLDVDRNRVRNRSDDMQAALEHAIALLDRHEPRSIMRLEMKRDLGRLYMRREQFARADEILEEVQREARERDDSDDLLLRLAGDLAVIAGESGRPEEAIEQFREVLRLKRAEPDVSPLYLATTLVNLAGLHADLGRYERAESRYQEVLRLLEPFDDLPQGTRATSLLGLADLRRWQGRFDEAESLIEQSAEEWRRLLDLESADEDFFIHYYLAGLYGDAHRFEAAAERIEVAIDRMQAGQEAPPGRIAQARADLARYRCRAGRIEAAGAPLERARERLAGNDSIALAEAEAVCAEGAGSANRGPGISATLLENARESLGDVARLVRLELARASRLAESGKSDAARALVDTAVDRLDSVGALEDHPLRVRARTLLDALDSSRPAPESSK